MTILWWIMELNQQRNEVTIMKNIHSLTPKPPMGWNSFDSYGCAASEKTMLENLEAMAAKLKPYGYEYFIIDNGWFAEYELNPDTGYPIETHAKETKIDEYGRYQPSDCFFPNGLTPIIDRAHELGLKFGIHMMRGIPRKAYQLNTPVKGTNLKAKDITAKNHICTWCDYNLGVDMDRPGSQEFYDSVVEQLASWGVDFIKVDDITYFPKEIEAYAKAIAKTGKDIVLSLSPGGDTRPERMEAYLNSNMLRTSMDVWDNIESIDRGFHAWKTYSDYAKTHPVPEGFWFDLDMIPFGHLCLWHPVPNAIQENQDEESAALDGKGYERWCMLNYDQKLTFITMRALAASPLFMGGNLTDLDHESFQLITHSEVLTCNQNGVMGYNIFKNGAIEIWKTPKKTKPNQGWLGIFNRHHNTSHTLNREIINFLIKSLIKRPTGKMEPPSLYNIWASMPLAVDELSVLEIPADGVIFIKYSF